MPADTARPPLGRILTFYSYKGGTGRSMALANVAWLLASAGRRVLVIDWDLEAPGLHRYFAPFLIDDEVTGSEGLIDLVDEYLNAAIGPDATTDPEWFLPFTDFSKHVVTINFREFPTGGGIDFLPAGRQGDHYALAVSSFNWQNFYDRLGGGGFFEAFKQRAREKYDYVLIDSRTGVSDTAGICSVQMPDSLVVCFTYNNQSIKGAAAVARSARTMHQKLVEERLALLRSNKPTRFSQNVQDLTRPFRVFPVPMRVDDGESDRLKLRQDFARLTFGDLLDHIPPNLVPEYWQQVQVPYRVFYAYEEVLAPFKDDPHNPGSVLASQIRLTSYITDNDVSEFKLLFSPEKKDEYLNAYAATPQGTATIATSPAKPMPETPRETVEQVLARKADGAIAALSEPERVTAQRVLLRLVRISAEEEGAGYHPIRVRLGDFREDERTIVGKLASFGVVAVSTEASNAQPLAGIDPTLLKSWSTLIDWVNEDRDFLVWRQELRGSLATWLRTDRDDGSLLSGRSLNEADLRLVRRRDDLTDTEIDYIERSKHWAPPQVSASPRSNRAPYGEGLTEQKAARGWSLWPVLLAAAALALVAAAWVYFQAAGPNAYLKVPSFPTPKFEGLTSTQARGLAEARGLKLVMSDGKSGDQAFIDGVVVVAQDPAADALASLSTPVRLTVTAATVSVPQLAGEDLTQALTLTDQARLKLGKTEYRYVPNAILGHIASQKPDAGTRVGFGTPIDIVVARSPKLNEVRIGIYYLAKDTRLATAIHDYLIAKGQQVELREKDMAFFTERGLSKENQVRYSAASEGGSKDELLRLLKDGDFGPFNAVTTRITTDGFISLFLSPYGTARK